MVILPLTTCLGFISPIKHLERSTLDFTSSLHMEGTITFNSPTETEPNFCFCWYSSENTAHRIGLGISNLTDAQNPPAGDGIGAVANKLRIDFGYGASGGNRFYNVSADGTATQSTTNSVMPNGTYPFEFDYVPGPTGTGGRLDDRHRWRFLPHGPTPRNAALGSGFL